MLLGLMCSGFRAKGVRFRALADCAVPRAGGASAGCARSTLHGRMLCKMRPPLLPRSAQARLIGVRRVRVRACVCVCVRAFGVGWCVSGVPVTTLPPPPLPPFSGLCERARVFLCRGTNPLAPFFCMGRSGGSRVPGRPQTSALAASARAHSREPDPLALLLRRDGSRRSGWCLSAS